MLLKKMKVFQILGYLMANKTENVKMFLFARWISTCCADVHIDGMSVLNKESGEWWKKQLEYFNETVYPNYLENKTVEDTKKFLNPLDI